MDLTVLACNFAEGTSECATGALAYVIDAEHAWNNRVRIRARSRSGRWITKYENLKRLDNFRLKTIPPEHPRYRDEYLTITVRGATEMRTMIGMQGVLVWI